jgi:hypothetical protein
VLTVADSSVVALVFRAANVAASTVADCASTLLLLPRLLTLLKPLMSRLLPHQFMLLPRPISQLMLMLGALAIDAPVSVSILRG